MAAVNVTLDVHLMFWCTGVSEHMCADLLYVVDVCSGTCVTH